jgi:ribosome-binding factor A
MTHRTEQLASVIQAAVQRVITRGLNDPRIRGLISITKVQVAPDLADARIDVSVLPAEHAALTVRGLQSAAGRIQHEMSRDIAARRVPRLSFRLDESLKKQARLDQAIAAGSSSNEDEPSAVDQPNTDRQSA